MRNKSKIRACGGRGPDGTLTAPVKCAVLPIRLTLLCKLQEHWLMPNEKHEQRGEFHQ
ncbi:hypothetical protein [Reticulibacter mediterranei]|uniref:hypothetical protein n=1 Tax=Reticulibacter mediterranei TaxID=2778369 RepID=UPI001C68A9A9|nr:hypothetical protein [Reticulibacter mediterranei]